MNSSGDSQSGSSFAASASNHSYVSCIEIDGKPILPPIMTESRRAEMRRYRELAVRIETNRRFNNKRQRSNHQIIPNPPVHPSIQVDPPCKNSASNSEDSDSDLDLVDNSQLNLEFESKNKFTPLPLNTTVTFDIQTSPISSPPAPVSISPPVSLSSTFTKSPAEFRIRKEGKTSTVTEGTIGGGISLIPGSPAAIVVSSTNSSQSQLQQHRRLPTFGFGKLPVPTLKPVQQNQNHSFQTQVHNQNLNQQQSASNDKAVANTRQHSDIDPGLTESQGQDRNQNQGYGYDRHFIIKKTHGLVPVPQPLQTHKLGDVPPTETEVDSGENQTSSRNSSNSNNSSSSSTSETQIHRIREPDSTITNTNSTFTEQQPATSLDSNSTSFTKSKSNDSESESLSSKRNDGLELLKSESEEFSFTGQIDDHDLIEEDDRSEAMSLVSLDTEEEQIRQEIVLGQHRQIQTKQQQYQMPLQNSNQNQPSNTIYQHSPFVTTRIRPLRESQIQIQKFSPDEDPDAEDSDNSLENYFPQSPMGNLTTTAIANSTVMNSGRSSTETFIIERHAAASDENESELDNDNDSSNENETATVSTATNTISTTTTDGATETESSIGINQNVGTDDYDAENELQLQAGSDQHQQLNHQEPGEKSTSAILKPHRKYYFSPIEASAGNNEKNNDAGDSVIFNSSMNAPLSAVKPKKSYFNSPSPVRIPVSSSSNPVPVPFKGYTDADADIDADYQGSSGSKLTEVSFVTSICSSTSTLSSKDTLKELTLSHTLSQSHDHNQSKSKVQAPPDLPTKLVNTSASSLSTPSRSIPTPKSGIPQLNIYGSHSASAAQSQGQKSPKEVQNGSKKLYFNSPETDVDAESQSHRSFNPSSNSKLFFNNNNSTLKNSTTNSNYNYSADHSDISSFSMSTSTPTGNIYSITSPTVNKQFSIPTNNTNTTPTKSTSTSIKKVSKIPLSPSKLNSMNIPAASPSPLPSPVSYSGYYTQTQCQSSYLLDGNGNLSKGSQNYHRIPTPNSGLGANTITNTNTTNTITMSTTTPRILRTPTKSSCENVQVQDQDTRETKTETLSTPTQVLVLRSPPIKKSFSMPYEYEDGYSDHEYHDQNIMQKRMGDRDSPGPGLAKNTDPDPAPILSPIPVAQQSYFHPGRVNLATLQTTMQNMSPSFFRVPPDARSPLLKGVVLMDPLFRPKRELRIPPQALDPAMKPKFARVTAAARGYLIRRLLRTEKIQMIIQTIRDTVELVLKLYEEVPQLRIRAGMGMNVRHEDAELCRRLFQQLTGACSSFHDVFFKLTAAQRMAIIAQDREKIRAKELKNYFSRSRSYRGGSGSSSTTISSSSAKASRQSHQQSRSVSSNNSKRKISTATVKCLERRMSALHS